MDILLCSHHRPEVRVIRWSVQIRLADDYIVERTTPATWSLPQTFRWPARF